jgi:predicted deacetylase
VGFPLAWTLAQHQDESMPSSPRLLLASIHDVSPRFESEVDRLVDLLGRHVGSRLAMLVVPNHWGDAPVVAGSAFAARLRGWADSGVEMFLHGFTHRDEARHDRSNRLRARYLTAGEGEFLGLAKAEASARIGEGRKLIEDINGRAIAGFIAPAWLYGRGAHEALREAAMPIAEDHFRVWSPATGRQLARGPVITWASRTRPRLASSLAAAAVLRQAPMAVLRIGVHPPDVHHASLVSSIEKTFRIASRGRNAGRYADLLPTRI